MRRKVHWFARDEELHELKRRLPAPSLEKRPATEMVRRVAAALWADDDYEGWERLNPQAQAHAERIARALEAAAECPHCRDDATQPPSQWRRSVCPSCKGTGIDPARLDAGLKRLEGG